MDWISEIGSDPIMTVNLGTRGPDDARNLLEYANHAGGSLYSDLRRANGREKPFDIRTWCLGNELDASWQICRKTPLEYGRLAAESARLMRRYDPSLELIAVGSSNNRMPTFPEWDRKVLMECYEDIDYIALHKYVSHEGIGVPAYLAAPIEMESQIMDIMAACDYVKSVKRSARVMKLAFDEWNVTGFDRDRSRPEQSWQVGPSKDRIVYTMEDALAFSSMLLALIRHADRVKMACQAMLINVLPMIRTEKNGGCRVSTTYYPFLHASLFGRGTSLQCLTDGPFYECDEYGKVPLTDTAAVVNEDRALTLFAVNRGGAEQELDIQLAGFGTAKKATHIRFGGRLDSANRPGSPEQCLPIETARPLESSSFAVRVPSYSWNVVRVHF